MADLAIVSALRERYPEPEWLVLPEVRSATGYQEGQIRYADALVVNMYPSGFLDRLIGFEFKVAEKRRAARADLRRELAQPEKASIGRFCSRWYFIVRAPWKLTVFSLDELPEGVGLLEAGTGKLAIVRESERRDPEPINEWLMLSLLRSASRAQEGAPPMKGIKTLTREKIILRCGHEIPRELVKRPGPGLPCYECAEGRAS